MAVAIRTITRLQDADDAPSLGAGQNGYALTWNNATSAFVATALPAAGVTDHGALDGLADDDHTQYLLATGARTGASSQAQTFTNGVVTGAIKPSANSTTALQLQNASGSSVLNVDTTNGRVGIGTTAPANSLDVNGYIGMTRIVSFGASTDVLRVDGNIVRLYAQSSGCIITSAATGGSLLDVPLAGGLKAYRENATTNAVENFLSLNYRTSGTAADGFGSAIYMALQSDTSQDTAAARIQALWYTAAHGTRKADLVLSAYDTAEREGLRIRGAGSAAAIGFLGATPAARQAHVADPSGGATIDAEARSAINSILSTLETFGLHATS